MIARRWRTHGLLMGLLLTLAACASAPVATEPPSPPTQAPPTQPQPPASLPPTPTASPATSAPTPQATTEFIPVLPVGAVADWTASSDLVDIQGRAEVVSDREIVITDFVSLVGEAPGVDIRLGVGNDFSDGVGLRLRDITGRAFQGRELRLRIPDEASGRTFDSIAVFCFETGEIFDSALFELP